ncbi:MAG: hypothetical protein IMF10_06620 [Proteobacteria bacterium]|nr:hypothetical protein [Pseudomonadota bacterium]
MGIIRKWSTSVEESIWKLSEMGSLASHKGLIGDAREGLFRETLVKYLPKTVDVGSGQIIDSNGSMSKQTDVIIARGDTLRIPLSKEVSVYPVEAVLAAIEIKSSFNKATLTDAVKNLKTISSLGFMVSVPDPRDDQQKEKEYLSEEDVNKLFPWKDVVYPSTYVYSFSSDFKAIDRKLANKILEVSLDLDMDLESFPSVIAFPGAVIIKNDGFLIKEDAIPFPWIIAYREETHPLYWILAHLTNRLSATSGGPGVPIISGRYRMETHLDPLPDDNWGIIRKDWKERLIKESNEQK